MWTVSRKDITIIIYLVLVFILYNHFLRGSTQREYDPFGLKLLAVSFPFSLPALGYATVRIEIAPPKKNRSRGGLVLAAVVPTRTAETCKGTDEGSMAGPLSDIVTAIHEEEIDGQPYGTQTMQDPHGGDPLDLISRSSGAAESTLIEKGMSDPRMEDMNMETIADVVGVNPPAPPDDGSVGVSSLPGRGSETFAPPLPSPELELGPGLSERLRLEEPMIVSDSSTKRPRSSDENPILARRSRSASSRIIISDDSEMEVIPGYTSARKFACPVGFLKKGGGINYPGKPAERRPPRSKKLRKETSFDLSFDDIPDIGFDDMTSIDAGGVALEWLSQLDTLRVKSGNLQGRVSGQMKIRIDRVREVINLLVSRAEARGDPQHLLSKNEALVKDLRLANRRIQDSRKEVKYGEERINATGGNPLFEIAPAFTRKCPIWTCCWTGPTNAAPSCSRSLWRRAHRSKEF